MQENILGPLTLVSQSIQRSPDLRLRNPGLHSSSVNNRLRYCANHFYLLGFSYLLKSKDTSTNVLVDFAINAFIILITFLFIMVSYGRIIGTVLQIKTIAGRKKAFSTCASHLIVVLIFFGSIIFMYVRLKESYSLTLDRTLAVVYSVLTPLVNPIIYSLRNKELIKAIKRTIFRKGERASPTQH
ncbi:hypothetical protein JEQ12_001037 [Ovis aries]|uniref:G-protein coupled receptors family 1 profile domain-containing protein n=1 Tax=Ovis aries TaxID=9940 RepID=A0A836AQC3_SHEEP|nr:hypothetical protein JEQ12_001037 [Ovis aries]